MIGFRGSTVNVSAGANPTVKLSKKRWLILFIFLCYTVVAGMQWLQYTIISNIIVKFYGVTTRTVEWTCLLYSAVYVFMIIPALYLLHKIGIRGTMIVATCGVCIGAWIKLFSIEPDRFYLVLIGQTFESISTVLTFGLAAAVTAAWFGADEISIAGAYALFGDQFGSALGFILPPLMVKNSENHDEIKQGLFELNMLIAGCCSLVLVLVIAFFNSHAPTPPSMAQKVQKEIVGLSVWKSFRYVLSKNSFLLMMTSYGINIGCFNTFATALNKSVLANFPGHEEDAGIIGFCCMLSGIIGSIVLGYYLDKKRLFKQTTVFVTAASLLMMLLFTFSLRTEYISLLYVTSIILGFFQLGYYATGVQMAIEVTYPVTESITAAFLSLSVQICGVTITYTYGYIFDGFGDLVANLFVCCLLFVTTVSAMLISVDLNRQNVEKGETNKQTLEAILSEELHVELQTLKYVPTEQ